MRLTSSLRDENLASNLLQASAGSGDPRDRVVSPACIEILCVAPPLLRFSRETFSATQSTLIRAWGKFTGTFAVDFSYLYLSFLSHMFCFLFLEQQTRFLRVTCSVRASRMIENKHRTMSRQAIRTLQCGSRILSRENDTRIRLSLARIRAKIALRFDAGRSALASITRST